MTVYILLTMVLNGKFEAMWGEHVTVIFFQSFRFKVIHFIDQDIKVSEKLNNMKFWQFCTALRCKNRHSVVSDLR